MTKERNMSIRKTFNQLLGLADTVEEEQKRFVERMSQSVFYVVRCHPGMYRYRQLFATVCYALGVDLQTLPPQGPRIDLMGNNIYVEPQLELLTQKDFKKTLEVLCIMYAHIKCEGREDKGRTFLSGAIETALSWCTCDIGVRWKDGFFYPSGPEELDEPLIDDVLTWLKDYPEEMKNYQAALRHYGAGDCLPDVVTNCYSAIEGIARKILDNNARLDQNEKALLEQIDLSEGWKKVLHEYVLYAHHYRHADPVRHDITPQETEAYLYMTGLIIRLAIESKKS